MKLMKIIGLMLAGILLLAAQLSAGAPAGHMESLDAEIRDKIIQNLANEGYMARFEHGQDVKRGVSAYLWDNRHLLNQVTFHNARQADVLICVMIRKGYGNFAEYEQQEGFMDWCAGMLK